MLAVLRHLTEAEGAARNAHVEMHAHEDDVVDITSLQDVPDFGAGVADDVLGLVDAEGIGLLGPGCLRIEAFGAKFCGPLRVLSGIIILSTIGLIEGIDGQLFGRDLFAPVSNFVRQTGGGGSSLGTLAGWGALIGLHATAGRVDDEHALGPGFLQHLIHARGHLVFAGHCVFAVMEVPHVADDDGGTGGLPHLLHQGGPADDGAGLEGEGERRLGGEERERKEE